MEIPIKMDDLGVPLFLETPIFGYLGSVIDRLHWSSASQYPGIFHELSKTINAMYIYIYYTNTQYNLYLYLKSNKYTNIQIYMFFSPKCVFPESIVWYSLLGGPLQLPVSKMFSYRGCLHVLTKGQHLCGTWGP